MSSTLYMVKGWSCDTVYVMLKHHYAFKLAFRSNSLFSMNFPFKQFMSFTSIGQLHKVWHARSHKHLKPLPAQDKGSNRSLPCTRTTRPFSILILYTSSLIFTDILKVLNNHMLLPKRTHTHWDTHIYSLIN